MKLFAIEVEKRFKRSKINDYAFPRFEVENRPEELSLLNPCETYCNSRCPTTPLSNATPEEFYRKNKAKREKYDLEKELNLF